MMTTVLLAACLAVGLIVSGVGTGVAQAQFGYGGFNDGYIPPCYSPRSIGYGVGYAPSPYVYGVPRYGVGYGSYRVPTVSYGYGYGRSSLYSGSLGRTSAYGPYGGLGGYGNYGYIGGSAVTSGRGLRIGF